MNNTERIFFFFFLRALGSLDHRWWINILMPVCHLAGFAYATIAIIIANELEIQTSFICSGARKLHLQKQILHSHAYNFFRNRTICQHQHRDNSLLIQLKSKPWNRCGMTYPSDCPSLTIGFIKRENYILRGHFNWKTTGEIKGYQIG